MSALIILCVPLWKRVCWRVIGGACHSCLVIAAFTCIIDVKVNEKFDFESYYDATHAFRFHCFCLGSNLLLGLLVLPSKEIAPLILAPIMKFPVGVVRLILGCCCPEKWRSEINVMLDNMMRVDGEEGTGVS